MTWCKKKLLSLLLILICLVGCGGEAQIPESAVLARVTYERGHGSMRGNELYVDVKPETICYASWTTPEYEDKELEDVPLTEESWQEIEAIGSSALPELRVVEEPGPLENLFRRSMPEPLDGGEYHELQLTWQAEDGKYTLEYQWTGSAGELALESAMETLVNSQK